MTDDKCFTCFDAYKKIFDAYKKVIESDVDCVILCEPPQFRPLSFEYAIQARKHIFAEKPIGVDPVGIRAVMAADRISRFKHSSRYTAEKLTRLCEDL